MATEEGGQFFISEGEVSVTDPVTGEQVDITEAAIAGLETMTAAVEAAGGKIRGPVRFTGPGGSLRLVRGESEDEDGQ